MDSPTKAARGETREVPARSRAKKPTGSKKPAARKSTGTTGTTRKPTGQARKPTRASKPLTGASRRGRKTSRWRFLRWFVLLLLMAGTGLAWAIWPFWQMAGQFGAGPVHQPSRLYGSPMTLHAGDSWTAAGLVDYLEAQGYVRVTSEMASGTYRTGSGWVEVHRRLFPSPRGMVGGNRLRIDLAAGKVTSLQVEGRRCNDAWLDPPLIASYYGSDLRERRPFDSVSEDLPEDLILSVLAIEDSGFLSHVGISLTGALRAAWTNLMEKSVRQGGSTLTQQLVKNLFLTHERTWTRKLREAVLAVFLEMRYGKQQIFRAYLNEIYWGRSGSVDLMGVGAVAWAYFSKQPAQLTLAESALLAGMIHSPASYSPFSSPERARERRNTVLERLAQLRWVETSRLEAAAREPITLRQGPLIARRAPYFADAMAEEVRRRFGLRDLRDRGYVLVSTLSLEDQKAAEKAVSQGLPEVEAQWEKKSGKSEGLQTALVSVDPATGGILAYVGGRDYGASQFDRVSLARRQPGSAFKPVVYAAALAERAATPSMIFQDAPYRVRYDGRDWSPKNSNGRYHGAISMRHSLERSLNVPTAKLALKTGLSPVITLAHDMGIRARISPFPALALGSMEVTPLEMATVYASLASGGVRPTVHGLEAVLGRHGELINGRKLEPPKRILEKEVAYLVTHALRGVLNPGGTAHSAREQGVHDALAGKTGTTNSRRDSWFGGYSPERATLVWVGYDDGSKTNLSGSRAALPLWARFTREVRPVGGYSGFSAPSGVVRGKIDPASGGRVTSSCPRSEYEYFLSDYPPSFCSLHGGGGRPAMRPKSAAAKAPSETPETVKPAKEGRFDDWLKMVRGKKSGKP